MKRWSVLLPARSGGKTRLDAPGDWSAACALDTLAAIKGSPLVDSITVLGDLTYDGNTVADTGTGLNNEIARIAAMLPRPLVIVLGDLPALTQSAFEEVLTAASDFDKGVVVDHQGSGTTMITVQVSAFTPHFGENSAALHIADGFMPLHADPCARLDLDTFNDLIKAQELGLGKETEILYSQM